MIKKFKCTRSRGKWIVTGGDAGWIFTRKFPTKWKAELALKIWQRQGRVSDYFKAMRAEKEIRADTREERARTAVKDAVVRFGNDTLRTLSPDTLITVRRQPAGTTQVTVRLDDLDDFHLRDTSGGIEKALGRPALFGRLWCDKIPEASRDRFEHSCAHGKAPHQILVCINKSDNPPDIFGRLLASSR